MPPEREHAPDAPATAGELPGSWWPPPPPPPLSSSSVPIVKSSWSSSGSSGASTLAPFAAAPAERRERRPTIHSESVASDSIGQQQKALEPRTRENGCHILTVLQLHPKELRPGQGPIPIRPVLLLPAGRARREPAGLQFRGD